MTKESTGIRVGNWLFYWRGPFLESWYGFRCYFIWDWDNRKTGLYRLGPIGIYTIISRQSK